MEGMGISVDAMRSIHCVRNMCSVWVLRIENHAGLNTEMNALGFARDFISRSNLLGWVSPLAGCASEEFFLIQAAFSKSRRNKGTVKPSSRGFCRCKA